MAKTNPTLSDNIAHLVQRLSGYLSEVPEHVARQAVANAMGEVQRYEREGDRPALEPNPLMEFAVSWMKAASPGLNAEMSAFMEATVKAGGQRT